MATFPEQQNLFPVSVVTLTEEIFEQLYTRYPRKEGKARGRKALEQLLRKPKWTVQRLHRCLDNYLALIEREGREKKYIKHFDTFIRNIEDYDGAPEGDGNDDLAAAILRGEL